MDDYHQPQHVKLVEEMLAELDGKELAAKSNALTGGSMRGEDALKVAKMVALCACNSPLVEVVVAGFGAISDGLRIELYLHGEVASREFPEVEKEEL